MAQGRIISPEFWTDVKMTKLSFAARLFYIGTWNHAYCDKGHLPDDAAELKMKILPVDAVDADELVAELLSIGRLERIEALDKSYLVIPTFPSHQRKDDPRWSRKCPVCRDLDKPRQTTQEHARGLRGGGGGEGIEVEGSTRGARPSRYCPQHPNGTTTGCLACRDARLAQQAWDDAPKASNTKAYRRGDGHRCKDNGHGYCEKCQEYM